MAKKVRMTDIADRLGISVVSVSKALAGKDGVSEEMRQQIITLADQMGYVPLRTKSVEKPEPTTRNIGILVADRFFADNAFYTNLYRQLLLVSNQHGYSLLLEIISKQAERECIVPAMIQGRKVDGLIFMGQISARYREIMLQNGLPYILLDFYDEKKKADSVTSDNISGGYSLTEHILQTGRKKIGFIGSIKATSSIMDRFLGYSKALLRRDIPVRMDWVLEDRDEAGAFIPLQMPEEMPEAFVCSCDEVAYQTVEFLQQQGYRIPEDVAVTGYDDYRFAQLCTPSLTTYRVNTEDMAEIAITRLIRAIKGKPVTKGNVVVNGDLVIRQST